MRTKKNISEIIYNINNYSRLEWFYYLMEEIYYFASNRPDINIRKDYLNDIVETQLRNLKLGYSILNELYKKFKKVLEGETYKEIFINDDEDLVIERKDNSMIFFRKKSYEKLTNLDEYFKLYNEDTAEKQTYQTMQKLDWNGQQNVLYDLFRQLRNIVGKNKQNPLLTNSIEEIALFLKQSFNNLENVSLSTIASELRNNNAKPNERPSSNKRIEINCK